MAKKTKAKTSKRSAKSKPKSRAAAAAAAPPAKGAGDTDVAAEPEKASKAGRPTKFNQAIATRILELAAGPDKTKKTDKQIAQAIGISESTLSNWKRTYPDFLEALKDAKSVADELAEASLFARAVGYSHEAVKFFTDRQTIEVTDPDTGEVTVTKTTRIISRKYTKHYPPDVTALIFWLKNRQPESWRDVHKHEHSGEEGGAIQVNVSTGDVVDAIKKVATEATAEDEFE